jgi:helix-turn-helix family protein
MDNRLKIIRKFKGLTQNEVAKILNTTQSQYGKYENGKTSISMENAKRLAEYYGVSVPYLLGLDDDSTNTIEKIPRKNIFSELAKNKGKSLKEISEETGIGYSTIGNYNQGSRIPKTENAFILADYFGVSVAYLLGLESTDSKIDNQIPRPIPFYNDLNLMLSEFKDSQVIESYIDFISKDKKYNPILLKAFKQFIVDEEGYFLTLISESSEKNSPYHYIWEEWNKEKNKKS